MRKHFARIEQFQNLGLPVTEVDKFSRKTLKAQTLYLKRLFFSELCSFWEYGHFLRINSKSQFFSLGNKLRKCVVLPRKWDLQIYVNRLCRRDSHYKIQQHTRNFNTKRSNTLTFENFFLHPECEKVKFQLLVVLSYFRSFGGKINS